MINGVITALVTPMDEAGDIDYASLDILLEQQISGNVAAIVVNGSTGESASLTAAEKIDLITYVLKYVNNRVKVLVGIGHSGTKIACEFLEQLEAIEGIYSYMVLTPPYVKPSQEGLYLHYKEVATRTSRPVIIYNVPSRTACNIEDDTILRLANDFSNIVGLKDATGNIARCAYLMKHKPVDFKIYSGDDETSLAFVLLGGNGVISVTSNVFPKLFSKMINSALNGEIGNARLLNNKLITLAKLMLVETNPIPVKWCLLALGILRSNQLRLPLLKLSDKSITALKPVLLELQQEEHNA